MSGGRASQPASQGVISDDETHFGKPVVSTAGRHYLTPRKGRGNDRQTDHGDFVKRAIHYPDYRRAIGIGHRAYRVDWVASFAARHLDS